MAEAHPDRIAVRGLTAHAFHGVYEAERRLGQTFRVDAVLELDTAPAAAGDDLERTVNYAELARALHSVLTGEPVDLLETLAQRLAGYNPEAMAEIKRVVWAGTEGWDALLAERAEISGRLVLSDFTRRAIAAFRAG